jgi:superfamily II DNA or RNA helicase
MLVEDYGVDLIKCNKFLISPLSSCKRRLKGTLVQYTGRLHRFHENKKKAIIYDYADLEIPMLARMFEKRMKGYRSIGYELLD